MKIVQIITLSLYIIISAFSCIDKDKRTEAEIERLIENNKDKALFLGFWEDIDEKDLKRVKEIETKKGNLRNDSFILKVPTDYEKYFEFPFEIRIDGSSIKLFFREEVWIQNDEGNDLNNYGRVAGERYKLLEKFLIKTFDEKYNRLKENYYVWKSKEDKIIGLSFYYSYYDSDECLRKLNNNYNNNNMKKSVFEPIKKNSDNYTYYYLDLFLDINYISRNGCTNSCSFNKKNNKLLVAQCSVHIDYIMFSKFQTSLKQLDSINMNIRFEQENETKKKKKEFENQIQDSKSKL